MTTDRPTDHYPVQSDCDVDCAACDWYNHEPEGRTWWDHLPDSLDAAWAEAEAALPEGWVVDILSRHGYPCNDRTGWNAMAECLASLDEDAADPEDRFGADLEHGQGDTPAAALRDLAAKLRERAG